MASLSDQHREPFLQALEAHRNAPHVTWNQHRRSRIAELWRMVAGRKRIYLDTRYWVFLRDAAMGRAKRPVHDDLLAVLRRLVTSGAAICPLSDSAMFELHKQTDSETRLAMAQIMDVLSLGATIQNGQERMRTELVRFFYAVIVEQRIPGPPSEHVWLKAGHFLGSATPVFEDVSPAEELAISKAFFDLLWTVTVEEILTDNDWIEDDTAFRWAAKRMTESSRAHAAEVTSFEQLYLAEVAGIVDASAPVIDEAFIEVAGAQGVTRPAPVDGDLSRLHRNAVYNIIRLGKAGTGLPLIQIEAGMHAAIRWLEHRPFQANDFYDIYHATAALPYCDVFLTELFAGTILKNRPLAFGKVFGTEIVWSEGDALQLLRTL
jgi:hypothetical protein